MSRELEFTGWWEGEAVYRCDHCGNEEGQWKDFCCERCRNQYIINHA